MKNGGRLAAAIEVLTEVENRHRPVQASLKDWGTSHRFAGSGDRTAIGNLVFDAMRKRASLAAVMKDTSPRAAVLATFALTWEKGLEALLEALEQDRHAPEALTTAETANLTEAGAALTPWQQADIPEWLWPEFETLFGDDAVTEGRALATRAPIDLRVNTLKADQDKVLKRIAHTGAVATKLSPHGARIAAKPGAGRLPHVQAEEGYQKGWFELQDEASQLAAAMALAAPGEQVLDYCAGGGGKTLALAAAMQNKGQLYAFDADRLRLAPIHERLKRAGVRNIQVRDPASSTLEDLKGQMNLVFIDAPCTGTGVWRRRPDSKWRLTEKALSDRLEDQRTVLQRAREFVRPGGRLAYVTCSLLRQENQFQVDWFLEENDDFELVSLSETWREMFPEQPLPKYATSRGELLFTPASTDTDGFFVALLKRRS